MGRRKILTAKSWSNGKGYALHLVLNGKETGPIPRARTYVPIRKMGFGDRIFYPVNSSTSVRESRTALGNLVSRSRSARRGFKIEPGEYGWWIVCCEPRPIERQARSRAEARRRAKALFAE